MIKTHNLIVSNLNDGDQIVGLRSVYVGLEMEIDFTNIALIKNVDCYRLTQPTIEHGNAETVGWVEE